MVREINEERIEESIRIAREIDNAGFEIEAALWMHDPENNRWWLYLASPQVKKKGSLPFYRCAQAILRDKHRTPHPLFETEDIKAIDVGEDEIQNVRFINFRLKDDAESSTGFGQDYGILWTHRKDPPAEAVIPLKNSAGEPTGYSLEARLLGLMTILRVVGEGFSQKTGVLININHLDDWLLTHTEPLKFYNLNFVSEIGQVLVYWDTKHLGNAPLHMFQKASKKLRSGMSGQRS